MRTRLAVVAACALLFGLAGHAHATTCGGPLPAGEFCSDAPGISSGVRYACTATAGSTANLRAALTIEETNGTDPRPVRSAALH